MAPYPITLSTLAMIIASVTSIQARTLFADPQSLPHQIRTLTAGDTLILKSGVYRMTLDMRGRRGSPGSPITIRGEKQGSVILTGSDLITGWQIESAHLYSATVPLGPSMVWINGHQLKQYGGTVFGGFPLKPSPMVDGLHRENGGVWPGRRSIESPEFLPDDSFWWDEVRHRLFVRSKVDPAHNSVEATVRERTLFIQNASDVVVENLVFERANTSLTNRGGSAVFIGDHLILRNLVSRENDLAGLQIAGNDNLIHDVLADRNGQVGVVAKGQRNRFVRVHATGNNTRGFNKWWEAGGFKFVGDGGLRDSELVDCSAIGNHGDGIWFDWKNSSNRITKTLSAFNTGFGIHYEASSGAAIENNVVVFNGQRGIYLVDSSQSIIRNNLVLGHALQGIVAVSSNRIDNQGQRFSSESNQIIQNVVAWNQEGALILPPDTGNVARANLYIGKGKQLQFSSGFPTLMRPAYRELAAWQQATGQDSDSVAFNSAMPAELTQAASARLIPNNWSLLRTWTTKQQQTYGPIEWPSTINYQLP